MPEKISDEKNSKEYKKKITNSEDLKEEMLEPIIEEKSEIDKELKDLEVENSAGGKDGGGG